MTSSAGAALLVVATAAASLGTTLVATARSAGFATSRRSWSRAGVRRLAVPLGLALVALAVTGWPLVALVAGAAAWFVVPSRSESVRTDRSDSDVLEALVSWIENLRDVLLAGDQPIGAIRATVATAAPSIRRQVRALAARLGRQRPDVVLRRFADEIDDPIGDLVATGLLIAVTRGARTVAVLSSLADQARHEVDRRRLVDVERAPVRREVVIVSAVMASLLVGLLAFSRSSYLDAYDGGSGQLFLAAALGTYAALLCWVRRLVRTPRPARFLSLDLLTVGR